MSMALRNHTAMLLLMSLQSYKMISGQTYTMIGTLTSEEMMAQVVIPGAADSKAFLAIVINHVIHGLNAFHARNSVLIMHNCQIHHNQRITNIANDFIHYLLAFIAQQ
jgi:hypothetical protein